MFFWGPYEIKVYISFSLVTSKPSFPSIGFSASEVKVYRREVVSQISTHGSKP